MNTQSLNTMINDKARNGSQTRPGFSLIELTAVLVIIGLLMAGAAVAVPGYLKRARTRVSKTSMMTIKTAITTYSSDNAGSAPESLAALIPNYLDPGAELDAWERNFYYRATPGATHLFELICAGPDGELQTEDDINVWTMNVQRGE